jgi:DNA-3-methyladenine glycosylase II
MSTPYYQKVRRHLSRKCPVMKKLISRVGPCTLEAGAGDPFTLLVRCVIAQQISTKAARSITARLTEAVGGPPVPRERIAELSDVQFQGCGVSGPKRRTLRALAAHFGAHPDLSQEVASRDDDWLRENLTAVSGIGPWTVDMFLMFAIMRPDILPVGDYGLKAAVKNEFGLKDLPKPAELEKIAEPWKPYRSIATWYLWRSLGPVPQSGDDDV